MSFEQVLLRTVDGKEFGPATMELLTKWQREGRVPPDAHLVDVVTGEARPVAEFPMLLIPPPPIVMTPASVSAPVAGAPSGLDHMIPTKNPKALFAYYLGIFGLLCAPLLGPIALVLGIMGSRDSRTIGVGNTHAWVGIILGSLEILGSAFAIYAIIIGSR